MNISSSLNAFRQQLPKIRIFPFRRLAATMHAIVNCMSDGEAILHRTLPPQHHIRSFHADYPTWLPVQLDKNRHFYAVVCYAFFCKLVVKSMRTGTYRLYHTFPSQTHLYTT